MIQMHSHLISNFIHFLALLCDFESDFCGFTFDLTAELNWTRSNSTPSSDTGPSSDHTHGDGKIKAHIQ